MAAARRLPAGPAELGVVNLIGGYVRTASAQEQQLAQGRQGGGLDQARSERDHGRTLARLVDPGRFPDAAEMFASVPLPYDGDFGFGLELILNGVDTLITTATRELT
ncbi:hypothetical protein FAF44_24380 [Nonomuraea sp. MG754425]|uniref:TetR/AcrR family transcriptional regulator C-terminal domain-containing protein n=1 Tax=Nonomuraea sp. MG754425 TaxID=2570319 RepID=UPI001F01D5E2|nr:TetR/AcrR family transcriptional regulator C-terminal domain-containing protein [Nonomuraea sp. MG754425]MCF6471505.1 hypothetical protein [Nonomuraea sp. MG754425]